MWKLICGAGMFTAWFIGGDLVGAPAEAAWGLFTIFMLGFIAAWNEERG